MTEPAHKTSERAPAAKSGASPTHATEAPSALLEQAPEVSAEGGEPVARRAALLGDPRLLQRMGADQRARLVRQIQRGQGNGHVARAIARGQATNQTVSVGTSIEEQHAPGNLTGNERPIDLALPPLQASAPEAQTAQRTEGPVQRNFLGDIVGAVTDPRKALLGKAADFAKSLPGYTMLTLILGKDPISGSEVERNPKNVFHAVLGLVPGGEKIFASLDESGAIDKAFAWLEQQFVQLGLNFNTIKGLFTRAWDSLSAGDLLHPIDAFEKVKGIFIEPITRLKNFVVAIGEKVLEFIFEGVMAKIGGAQVLSMLQRAGSAFQQIIKDPIGFLSNLLSGVKQGFVNFGKNILTHLGKGIMTWLFGELAAGGIELPKSFDLKGILSLVMQVLGLTWTSLRAQAVKMFGEKTVARLESGAEAGFKIFQIVAGQGIGGLWEFIKEQIGNLKDMVLDGIKELVTSQIVQAGIQWLIGILGGPAGALVKAVQTIYNVVMWFVDNASRLAELISSIGESIGAIASGAVGQAANFIEKALGNSVPVLLGLLAKLLGLGNLSQKIKGVIEKIQAPVQKAIGWVLGKAKSFAMKIGGGLKKVGGKVKGVLGIKNDTPEQKQKQKRLQTGVAAGVAAVNKHAGKPVGKLVLKPILAAYRLRYRLAVLEPIEQGKVWAVHGELQRATLPTDVPVGSADDSTLPAITVVPDTVPDTAPPGMSGATPGASPTTPTSDSSGDRFRIGKRMRRDLIAFWAQKAKDEPDKADKYHSYIDRIRNRERPTPSQSETEMAFLRGTYGLLGESRQEVPYLRGREVEGRPAGHTRPDVKDPTGTLVEVKRYKIENINGMIQKLIKQISDRAEHLPYDLHKRQSIIIDFRGQQVSRAQISEVRQRVVSEINAALASRNIELSITMEQIDVVTW